uniref:F-box domain-containing protein n=1 Tax=Cyprinus carpio TaxID=7962 RepID=A0A8C1YTW1_CYPCA
DGRAPTILLNLPAHQVVRVCSLVCQEWKELVDSVAHWRERCLRKEIQSCDASRPLDYWCLFYFITKKGRNLLKNPRENTGSYWFKTADFYLSCIL